MDTSTGSNRTALVPLSLGKTEVTLTVTGDVTERPVFRQALDEAVGLLILAVTMSLSSLGTKSGTRGQEHLTTTTVGIDLNFGDSTYSFVIVVRTDMQGVTKADVAKLLKHMPCKAASIVEYINTRTTPKPDPLISKLGSLSMRGLFDSAPFDGAKNPVGFDLSSYLVDFGSNPFGSNYGDRGFNGGEGCFG